MRYGMAVRDERPKAAFGVWDHIKNHGDHGAETGRSHWVGSAGKRESRRCLGDHLLTRTDVRAGGAVSDDVAAYAVAMDDHHPGACAGARRAEYFHPAPSPCIPNRCLYSRNIANLFAGGTPSA